MIALVKWILARIALFKLLLKSFGALAWLLPIALLLKALGWPVLLVLGILAIPLVIVLMVIGLPLLLVAAAGGVMMMIVFWVVTTSLLLLKIAAPILLLLWVLRWMSKRNGRDDDGKHPGTQDDPPTAGEMPESGLA